MRRLLGGLAFAAGIAAAGAAAAAPSVEIKHAVVRVIVQPEARADIKVEIVNANRRLPLRITTFLGRTYVDGGVMGARVRSCHGPVTQPSAYVLGVGEVTAAAMPMIVVHTPLQAKVSAAGAVFGQVARGDSLDLVNAGCGDWDVGNVRGKLKLIATGSGSIHAGQASGADVMTAGSGGITLHEISGSVSAENVGSGDIEIAGLHGPLNARIAGSGHVRVAGGHASAMRVSIAGSGDVELLGVADSLSASVVGSGDVKVAKVTGPISKTVVGSGEVRIGS
ncbi:MAG TPA: DUF2807 domain-containing protein [Caulobacteraceae bacterium]